MSIFDLARELGKEKTDDLGYTHYSFDEASLVKFFSSVYSMGARQAVSVERKELASHTSGAAWLLDTDAYNGMTREQYFEYVCHFLASGILSRNEGEHTAKMIGDLVREHVYTACQEVAEREAKRLDTQNVRLERDFQEQRAWFAEYSDPEFWSRRRL